MPATSPIINIMIRAAEKAARSLVRDFGEVEQLQISRKGPGDFVTNADKRSEKIIFEELQKARPSYSFLMEESGQIEGDDKDHVWIIDPLDGTHNFMHGIPYWNISIALEKNGEIQAGIVYEPIRNEMFHAEKGTGAFIAGNKRLRVSGRSEFDICCFCSGHPFKDGRYRPGYLQEIEAVAQQSPMIRRTGAAALDLCYVAAGRFDGFWERGLQPWDVAAAGLIVKEAGGIITSIDNNDNPVYSRNLVAGNGNVHGQLRQIIKKAAA